MSQDNVTDYQIIKERNEDEMKVNKWKASDKMVDGWNTSEEQPV